MKNPYFLFAATFTLFFAAQTALSAQKVATWKGGTPGRSNDWNSAQNWADGRVPNEFSVVIIPNVATGSRSYPVIHDGEVEVLRLEVHSGAELTLDHGARLIADEWNCNGICHGCEVRIMVEGVFAINNP